MTKEILFSLSNTKNYYVHLLQVKQPSRKLPKNKEKGKNKKNQAIF